MSNRERMNVISLRTQKHRQRILGKSIRLLTVQAMLLVAAVSLLTVPYFDPTIAAVPGMFGSVLLPESVDVLIPVGIAAFIPGIIVTMVCMHDKNRH